MCGIVGVIKKDTTVVKDGAKLFHDALFADQLRGYHSTGMISVSALGEVRTYKKALCANDFMQLREANNMLNLPGTRMMIGHNRYATTGAKIDANAHPFTVDHITMVHNGTIRWPWFLNRMDFNVDSEAVCYMLAHTQDLKADLERIEGAYALVWYDTKEEALYLCRNDERPLHVITSMDGRYTTISSEAELMTWVMMRNQEEWKDIYDVKPGQLFRIGLEEMTPKIVMEFTPHKPEPVQRTSYMDLWDQADRRMGADTTGTGTAVTVASSALSPRKQAAKAAVDGFLAEHGMHLGKTIHFEVFDVKEQEYPKEDADARLGLMEAFVDNEFGYSIKCHKVDMDEIYEEVICTGVVVGVQPARSDKDLPIVWVSKVEPWDFDFSPDVLEDLVDGEYVLASDDNTPDEHSDVANQILDPLAPMLHRRMRSELDEGRFWQLVKNGCAYCADPVQYEDVEETLWTQDGQPICKACVGANKLAPVTAIH